MTVKLAEIQPKHHYHLQRAGSREDVGAGAMDEGWGPGMVATLFGHRPALRLDSCQWYGMTWGWPTFLDVSPKLSTPRKVTQPSQVHRPL